MIWEKIKDHFFDDFRDEITMDLPTYTPFIKVQSILKGNTIMINKESLLNKVQTLSSGRLILIAMFIFAALFTVFYSNEESSVLTPEVTEESIKNSAKNANTTVISSNLPVEAITSIEKITTQSGNKTKKIVQHNLDTKQKIDSITDDYIVQTSKPLVITINSKDKKEIAVLYNYETTSTIPPSTPILATENNNDNNDKGSDSIKPNLPLSIPPEINEPIITEKVKTETTNTSTVTKKDDKKVSVATNTIIIEKENITVSKEKIKLLKDISVVLDNQIKALEDLDTFKEEQIL